jgi:hypothetical protein
MLAAPGGRKERAMRLTLHRWAITAALLLAPLLAAAQIDPGSAERLLRKSGLWVQLDGVAQQVRQGLVEAAAQAGRAAPAAEADRLQAAAVSAYAVERLRSVALRLVSRQLELRYLQPLLDWYDTPTGVLMTRLEEQSAGDLRDTGAVMDDGMARWQAMSAERRGSLEALLQASGSVDSALSMTLNTVAGVWQGLAGVLPPAEAPSPEATRALLADQLPRLRPAMEQMLRAVSAVAYAEASDAQLQEYLGFLRSPAGQHLGDVMQQVLDAAFLEGATELGRRLAPAAGTPA